MVRLDLNTVKLEGRIAKIVTINQANGTKTLVTIRNRHDGQRDFMIDVLFDTSKEVNLTLGKGLSVLGILQRLDRKIVINPTSWEEFA